MHYRKDDVDFAYCLAPGDAAGFNQRHAAVKLDAGWAGLMQKILDFAAAKQRNIFEFVVPIPHAVLANIDGFHLVLATELQWLDHASQRGHHRDIVLGRSPAKDNCNCFHVISIYN